MYCPINKVTIGTRISYLGLNGIVVKQFGGSNGTNVCCLDTNNIIEFGDDGAHRKVLINDDKKRMKKDGWYYSYKAMVRV